MNKVDTSRVEKELNFQGIRIQLLMADNLTRNVVGVDESGKTLWTVAEVGPPNRMFTNIYDENGQLKGYNLDGFAYVIDSKTGAVTQAEYLK